MDISAKLPVIDAQSAAPAVTPAAKTPPVRALATPPAADKVELSAQAQSVCAAQRAIKQLSPVDAAKVARIKAQVAAGTYRVDSHKTAAAMIKDGLLNDLE